jgi:large subunit ribosomal protein L25
MSVVLSAQIRTAKGKSGAGRIRGTGQCPAVVYGPGAEPVPVQVDPKAFLKLLHAAGENALIDLEMRGEGAKAAETRKVIVREIQYHPMRPLPQHVDFYVVNLERLLAIKVSLELVGIPAAVTTKSGTLTQQVHELHVECLPTQIPTKIEADVSGLALGQSLHVRDLKLPAGVTVLDQPDLTVAGVFALHAEVEAEAAPQLETAEPEVIRERKPAGEEEKEKQK